MVLCSGSTSPANSMSVQFAPANDTCPTGAVNYLFVFLF
jgi:hypothetical protein